MFAGLAAAGLALAGCGSSGTSQSELDAEREKTAQQAEMVMQLQNQINAALAALGREPSDDLGDSIADLQAQLATLQQQVTAAEEAARMAAEEAARKAAEEAAAMMAATAAKLYTGINAPSATAAAAYDTTDNSLLQVTRGTAEFDLSEDEDTTVDGRHGWAGQRFAHTVPSDAADGAGDTYEARVYSHVGDPTEGAKFNDSANGGYTLNADDQIADVASVTGYAGLVASASFDQSAGTKTFDLAENREYVELGGTFNGVPGTYTCVPTAIATDRDTCGSTKAAMGFTLIGGTWTFEPNDPEARLKNVPDNVYASYGWWLHKSKDGKTYTASAFHAYRGTDAGTVGIADLRGSATYTGGAAGKYALSSTTGGTNDAGHFTADVELTATFAEDHKISGTVDNFIGGDGMARDWSVALNDSVIADAGAIAGDPEDSTDTGAQMTVWTIGGVAADASGQWSGDLREQGDDGVPAIATGTFHSVYGRDGAMVGAFGANKQ